MSTQDELERAVERLNRAVERLTRAAARASGVRAFVDEGDLDLLLSERAELLATVERMRGALEAIRDFDTAYFESESRFGYIETIECMDAEAVRALARAALTTGEEK